MDSAVDLRRLRYFVTVAEEGHFGRAAKRLHIVQPALSMQIRALEEEMGGLLLVRTSRRVALTDAGELLLNEARRLLARAEQMRADVRRSLRGETGRIRVGFAGNAVLTGKLMDDLRDFHRAHPEVELQLQEIVPQRHGEAILAGELDVAYGPSFGARFDAQLVADTVGEWPLVVAMVDDHPLASKARITPKALATEPLILYAADDGDEGPQLKLRQLLGDEARAVHRVSSTISVLALVAAGMGLALVPGSLTHVNVPRLIFRPLVGAAHSADLVLLSRAGETNGAVLSYLRSTRQREKRS